MREYWVVNAARRVVHCHYGVTADGYVDIADKPAAALLLPRHARKDFAFVLDDLEML